MILRRFSPKRADHGTSSAGACFHRGPPGDLFHQGLRSPSCDPRMNDPSILWARRTF